MMWSLKRTKVGTKVKLKKNKLKVKKNSHGETNYTDETLPLISPLVLTITKPQREDNKNDMCTCKIMPQEIF